MVVTLKTSHSLKPMCPFWGCLDQHNNLSIFYVSTLVTLSMLSQADIKRHRRYHQRLIGVLPAKYQTEDPNKIAMLYFSLCSLALLEDLPQGTERAQFVALIRHLAVETGVHYAFVPSSALFPHGTTLSATCFALQCLLILEDDLEGLPLHKIGQFVAHCQHANGGFTNTPGTGTEVDLRFAMLALTILKIAKLPLSTIDVKSLAEFVRSTQAPEGGFGADPGAESHSGLTFCAVDALSLCSHLDMVNTNALVDFLVHRQIFYCREELEANEYADEADEGGFNGRYNKYGDTCYVFWSLASLALLNKQNLIDAHEALSFLQRTHNTVLGGFNKTTDPDDFPDPLHSFLGLAALSLLGQGPPLDPQLVIPVHARARWELLPL